MPKEPFFAVELFIFIKGADGIKALMFAIVFVFNFLVAGILYSCIADLMYLPSISDGPISRLFYF